MQHTRTRYRVPTHLKVPDKILFGFTARQLLILLIGGSLGYNLWFQLTMLGTHGMPGQVLRILLVSLPMLTALAFSLVSIAERPLELWVVILVRYWQQPKTCVWRSVRRDALHRPAKSRGFLYTRRSAPVTGSPEFEEEERP